MLVSNARLQHGFVLGKGPNPIRVQCQQCGRGAPPGHGKCSSPKVDPFVKTVFHSSRVSGQKSDTVLLVISDGHGNHSVLNVVMV